MKIHIQILILWALSLTFMGGCSTRNSKLETSENKMDESAGYTEKLGQKSLSGTPYLTKGAQMMLEGVILSDKATLEKHGLHNLGSTELSQYTLTVKGNVNRYHCGPMEQCLSEGYIDFMPEIDEIKVNL